jgi:uncharacterized protein YcsI (UPF0317 family)
VVSLEDDVSNLSSGDVRLVERRRDIVDVDDDMVCFLLGCGYSFEHVG